MRWKVQVTTSGSDLNVRNGPSTSEEVLSTLSNGSVVIVNDTANNGTWYRLEDGGGMYISAQYCTFVEDLDASTGTGTVTQDTTTTASTDDSANTADSGGLDETIINMLYTASNKDKGDLDASTRLFGAPFQFLKSTDFRLNSKVDLGRKYLETIVGEAPIVYFIPGKPNYLPDLSESEKKGMMSFFVDQETGDTKTALDSILNNQDIRYFDFIPDYPEYMRYVNLLCRVAAIYIGLGDKEAPNSTTPYKYYDWSNYKYKNNYTEKNADNSSVFDMKALAQDMYEQMFGKYQYIQFYVEPNTSFSESQSNNTTQSKLAGMFDSAEGIIKEVSFLTNTAAVKDLDKLKDTFASGMNDIKDNMLKNSKENFFTRLLGMSSTVLTGSNIIFPELWGDSAYNKSYNVTVNLVSPYGDPESVFLNCIVPMLHLLALALPRQSTANSYASPFLVKVFSKGWFSCELGIVDSISIDKGGDNAWTADGLPSEIKVTLGIKDLYTNLMQTSGTKPSLFFQNQGLIDFLAVSCGVDITQPNFIIKLETMFSVFLGRIMDIPANAFRDLMQNLKNQVDPLFKL